MYHQFKPTEIFRERELALLKEAENRRLVRRLRAKRIPMARSTIAAVLGLLAALVVAGIMVVGLSSPAHASTTFTVDDDFVDGTDINPGDGVCDVNLGAEEETCTLRAAIQEANRAPGADVINFNITRLSDGFATIKPNSQLPDITDRVTIDGYTQPGASPNTLAQGTNALLKIELLGTDAGTLASGLVIESGGSGSVVKGLGIRRFDDGIILRPDSTQNRIEGNFIGTDLGGTFDEGNAHAGVQILNSNTSASNTIGGSSPAARNLISGNNGIGVGIIESTNNLVAGNLIGTKKDGITALGNSSGGVSINRASNNTVSGNTIAFNGEDGVGIFSIGTGNLLAGNSIFSNVEEGIDLGLDGVTLKDLSDQDTGANTLQNKPLVTSAKTSKKATTIKGKLNSTSTKTFLVQLFSNASGNEGRKVIGQTGVTTDASGNATFTFEPAQKVRKGKITATATDTGGKNTSELSVAKKVVRKR